MSREEAPEQDASSIARWWRQADQFGWLIGYLRVRGLEVPTRLLMALISGALVLTPMGLLSPRSGLFQWSLAVSVVACVVGIAYTVLWLRGWPSRKQSLSMAVLGGGLIAAGCVLQRDPVLGMMGCTGLVIIGGYVGLFHNTKAIAVNVALAIAASVLCASRVIATREIPVVAAGLWLVIELNLAVPLALQAVVRTLGADVVRSDHDPLTGLLNRRAFHERAAMLLTSPSNELFLIAVMIDLDRFKDVNDTYGHVAGDQALSAVGWALRQHSGNTSIIGRFGGEEFLVVDALPADPAHALPGKLCAAIAALPQPVTASVGAALLHWGSVTDPGSAIEQLIRAADKAMYTAKRNGGNRSHLHQPASA
ncbi:GGDEF domain-containing protein [Mycobacterium sp. Marseille-P9652]|uniref:GGDEF domain-containing protein n=1 Tax=Mycobacterium sp. Marseille-P9652 TaxID=2654950 RepID=UPI001E63A1B5|nr:GGDEF domain-containing protein [Mycobacterium sp. Marseille-P9652]